MTKFTRALKSYPTFLIVAFLVLAFNLVVSGQAPPEPIVIGDGALFTNKQTVTLTLNMEAAFPAFEISNATEREMLIYETERTWQPYNTPTTWTLSTGDGPKRIYAVFRFKYPFVITSISSSEFWADVTLDTASPELNITTPTNNSAIESSTQQITWTVTDSGSGVDYTEVVRPDGNVTNVGDGLSYSLTDLANGNYLVGINSHDRAGNIAAAIVSFTVNIPGGPTTPGTSETPTDTPTTSPVRGGGIPEEYVVVIALVVLGAALLGGYSMLRARRQRSPRSVIPPPGKLRWIQSQVFEVLSNGKKIRQTNAFRGNALHSLAVRVGPANQEWLTPKVEVTFPEDKLVWEKDYSGLQVVFSEPNHAPTPQIGKVILPREGSSTTCQFSFTPKQEIPYFKGRVIVLQGNRVLQTALLEGQVVSSPEQFPELRLSFGIESIIHPDLSHLSSRKGFDVAFMANHTVDDSPGLTTITGDQAYFNRLTNIEAAVKDITKLLESVITYPEDYQKPISDEKNLKWLRDLALNGKQLYDGIVVDQIGRRRLTNINRVQLISTVDEYLPLEFMYDMPAPRFDAPLCGRWREALQNGQCQACTLKDAFSPAEVLCPIGFWGLRLIIERHYLDPYNKPDLKGYDFALKGAAIEGRRVIKVLKSAVFAVSDRVDKVVAQGQGSQNVLEALKGATHQRVAQVDTLEHWRQAILELKPSLIVLLTHISLCDAYPQYVQLEIGQGVGLPQPYINRQYVLPSEDAPRPVVLLLGCTTMSTAIPFRSLATSFRREGAAIVLSTITEVLGRQVAPVSADLVNSLEIAAEKGLSLGDALLMVRRKALADGKPMVLSLVGIGDADWRFEGEESA